MLVREQGLSHGIAAAIGVSNFLLVIFDNVFIFFITRSIE